MATAPGGAESVGCAVPRNSGAAFKLMKGIIVARDASVNLGSGCPMIRFE